MKREPTSFGFIGGISIVTIFLLILSDVLNILNQLSIESKNYHVYLLLVIQLLQLSLLTLPKCPHASNIFGIQWLLLHFNTLENITNVDSSAQSCYINSINNMHLPPFLSKI